MGLSIKDERTDQKIQNVLPFTFTKEIIVTKEFVPMLLRFGVKLVQSVSGTFLFNSFIQW